MIDVNKDKIICVSYMGGSGGCFIIAALSLSGQCLPASSKWLQKPLSQKVILDSYLTNFEQSIIANKWQDFGLEMDLKIQEDPSTECFPKQTETDMYLIGGVPTHETYASISKIWKNVTIIHFINSAEFAEWRSNMRWLNINDYWQTMKGESWPDMPPNSIEELALYPLTIRQELADNFNNDIMNYLNLNKFDIDPEFKNEFIPYTRICPFRAGYNINYRENHNVIKWNCQNFFSRANTINGVAKLYEELGLSNFDITAVSTLYQKWISTLRTLNNNRIA